MHSRQVAMGAMMALACGNAAMAQAIYHDDVTLHPGYTLTEAHPAAWIPQVSGMDFMADGRLVVLTHLPALENVTGIPKKVGTLNIVTNPGAANPEEITYKQIAAELGEPMGVCVVDGKIYVTEKMQLTEFSSADGNTWTARKVGDIPNDPAGATNFQEYPFGLLYKDGFFYTASQAHRAQARRHPQDRRQERSLRAPQRRPARPQRPGLGPRRHHLDHGQPGFLDPLRQAHPGPAGQKLRLLQWTQRL